MKRNRAQDPRRIVRTQVTPLCRSMFLSSDTVPLPFFNTPIPTAPIVLFLFLFLFLFLPATYHSLLLHHSFNCHNHINIIKHKHASNISSPYSSSSSTTSSSSSSSSSPYPQFQPRTAPNPKQTLSLFSTSAYSLTRITPF